jgi:AcrR family transcriptional regulator
MDGVSATTGAAGPAEGLRERRKRETRERIVAEGLRLFAEQGYGATTCEQIAAAADVSPATFYRYFPTKEDVVLRDEYDPLLLAALATRPAAEHPIDAVVAAISGVLEQADPQEEQVIRSRTQLILGTPALRARLHEQDQATAAVVTDPIARRLGLPADDVHVRVLAAAIVAALHVAMERWAVDGGNLAKGLTDALLALRTSVGPSTTQAGTAPEVTG